MVNAKNELKRRRERWISLIALLFNKLSLLLIYHKNKHVGLWAQKTTTLCLFVAISLKILALIKSEQRHFWADFNVPPIFAVKNLHFWKTGAHIEQNWVSKVSSVRFVKSRREQKSHNAIDNFVKQAVTEAERLWLQPPMHATNKVNYVRDFLDCWWIFKFDSHSREWENSSRWCFNYACGKWIWLISVSWFNQAADFAPISSSRGSNHFLQKCGSVQVSVTFEQQSRPVPT